MSAVPISLDEQATEVELLATPTSSTARRGCEIKKRPPEEIERRRIRHAAASAAARTLRDLAKRDG